MFDAPEASVDPELNAQLMSKYDILITTRHKPKQQDVLSFILKGIERNVG